MDPLRRGFDRHHSSIGADVKHQIVRRVPAVLFAGFFTLAAPAVLAQPGYYPPPSHYPPPPPSYRHSEARQCDFYARDQAYRYAPPGAGGLHGAAHGAVKGAVFGAIVGGSKGARRGAAVGGGLGAVAAGARSQRDRDYAYQYAYDDCMRGFRR